MRRKNLEVISFMTMRGNRDRLDCCNSPTSCQLISTFVTRQIYLDSDELTDRIHCHTAHLKQCYEGGPHGFEQVKALGAMVNSAREGNLWGISHPQFRREKGEQVVRKGYSTSVIFERIDRSSHQSLL